MELLSLPFLVNPLCSLWFNYSDTTGIDICETSQESSTDKKIHYLSNRLKKPVAGKGGDTYKKIYSDVNLWKVRSPNQYR